MQHFKNYIDGQWIDSDQSIEIIDPSNGDVFATMALASHKDADKAMRSAKACVNSKQLTSIRPAQ